MLSVVLIGTGNVSSKLQQAFIQSEEVRLLAVCGKQERIGESLPSGLIISDIGELDEEADILLIAVQDDAISTVVEEIGATNALVAHTSGSMPLDELLPLKRRAVFYPLQTLSVNRDIDFSTVPLCLECAQKEDRLLIQQLAEAISGSVTWSTSRERERLHLAAVFANNFVNHMIREAEKICEQYDIPNDMLHPLIDETIAKAKEMGASIAQTGPAMRGDDTVLEKQVALLSEAAQQKLYKTITASIQHEYESQL